MSNSTFILEKCISTLIVALMAIGTAVAQQPSASSLTSSAFVAETPPLEIEPVPVTITHAGVIEAVLQAEKQVRESMKHYSFRRDVVLQTIGPRGEVTGEYIRNSQFVFDDRGNRVERVLFHPRSTIREMKITKEDIQDLAGAQLLGVDINEVGKYLLVLAGKQSINGREAYAIDVRPAQTPDPYRMRERFLVGRIWVDAGNLQILKVRGTVEPHGKQRFPIFETSREESVGPFLFPARTEVDDVLHFPKRSVHYRITVRYYGYKRFASTVNITEVEEPLIK